MDIYQGIHSEIVSSNRFHENSDLSTTYLGRVDKEKPTQVKGRRIIPYIRTWLYFR